MIQTATVMTVAFACGEIRPTTCNDSESDTAMRLQLAYARRPGLRQLCNGMGTRTVTAWEHA